jgi:hypothetical protein
MRINKKPQNSTGAHFHFMTRISDRGVHLLEQDQDEDS